MPSVARNTSSNVLLELMVAFISRRVVIGERLYQAKGKSKSG